MRFNIANKAPITVNIGGTDYKLPVLRRRFWIEWASELDGKRTAEATSALSPAERAKMLLIYPVEPVGHQELVRRISTPEGVGRIISASAAKSDPAIPKETFETWLDDSNERDLETLALMLAGIMDFAEQLDKKAKSEDTGKVEEPPDPLKSSSNA